jgi:hypothetical protein
MTTPYVDSFALAVAEGHARLAGRTHGGFRRCFWKATDAKQGLVDQGADHFAPPGDDGTARVLHLPHIQFDPGFPQKFSGGLQSMQLKGVLLALLRARRSARRLSPPMRVSVSPFGAGGCSRARDGCSRSR